MSIEIPSQFLARVRLPIEWADIAYAYENRLIDSQAVIDYACQDVSKCGNDSPDVFAVACAKPSDSLIDALSRIAKADAESTDSIRKWAVILAAYIAERDDLDQLSVIEDVYSSHDYPSELSPFVRYMPMTDPDLGSPFANEQRMISRLKEFAESIVMPDNANTA